MAAVMTASPFELRWADGTTYIEPGGHRSQFTLPEVNRILAAEGAPDTVTLTVWCGGVRVELPWLAMAAVTSAMADRGWTLRSAGGASTDAGAQTVMADEGGTEWIVRVQRLVPPTGFSYLIDCSGDREVDGLPGYSGDREVDGLPLDHFDKKGE